MTRFGKFLISLKFILCEVNITLYVYINIRRPSPICLSKIDFMFFVKGIVAYFLLSLRFGFHNIIVCGNKFGIQY